MPFTDAQKENIKQMLDGDQEADPPIRGVESYLSRMTVIRNAVRALLLLDEQGSTHPSPMTDVSLAKTKLKAEVDALSALLA